MYTCHCAVLVLVLLQHFLHEYVLQLLYQFVTRYQAAPQVVDALVITPVRGYGNFLELGDIDASFVPDFARPPN